MARRPRIHWQPVDNADVATWWTPGWLPDTQTLRWSLANDLRIEGVAADWRDAFEVSEAAEFYEGYVAEDEAGDYVYVTPEGCLPNGEEHFTDFAPATFARLEPPVCN